MMLAATFRLLDAVDILVTAFLLYQFFRLIRGTVAMNISVGIAALYLVWKITEALEMRLLSEVLGQFLGVGVIALIIVFQQEVRKFLLMLGSSRFKGSAWPFGKVQREPSDPSSTPIEDLADAAFKLGAAKTGALVVLGRNSPLKGIAQTGVALRSEFSVDLLISIFNKDSPLHDGALVLLGRRVEAARCILPVSDNHAIPGKYGLRHRSAVGITERTDALALVVSEETGQVSLVREGIIQSINRREELIERLREDLQ
jgi:uncharacterized protein (TIGR00159 family)